jgi:uncharacterized protein (TIGR03437 family)
MTGIYRTAGPVCAAYLYLLAPALAGAEGPLLDGMTCVAKMDIEKLPNTRAQGLAELMPNVVIDCTGGTPAEPGQPLPQTTLGLTANVTINSKILDYDMTEAVLMIGEPQPGAQFMAQSGVGMTAGCDTGPECPNIFLGNRKGPKGLEWTFALNPPGDGNVTIRIANVRLNVDELDPRPPYYEDETVDDMFAINSSSVNLLWPYVTNQTGFDTGLVLQKTSRDPFRVEGRSFNCFESVFGNIGTIVYKENNPADLQTRHSGQTLLDPFADPVPQNIPGQHPNTTAGFTDFRLRSVTRLRGTFDLIDGIGSTDAGTRIVTEFANLPPDGQLFIPVFNDDPSPTNCARLIDNLYGPAIPVPDQGNGFAPRPIDANGRARAIWEVCGQDSDVTQTLRFPIDLISTPNSFEAGDHAIWTLSTGGTVSVSSPGATAGSFPKTTEAVPGFQGYVIAQAQFQMAHGYAFISDVGASKLAQGYLALVMDEEFDLFPRRKPLAEFTECQVLEQGLGGTNQASAGDVMVANRADDDPYRFELTPTGYLPKLFSILGTSSQVTGITVEVDTGSNPGNAATVDWLTAIPRGSSTPLSIHVSVSSDGFAAGTYPGAVNLIRGGTTIASIAVEMIVPEAGPRVKGYGVTNAGSYASNIVGPGEAIVLFGSGLGPASIVTLQLVDGKAATEIGGTRILFDGVAAPMIYAADGQASAFVPFGLAGPQFTEMVVEHNGVKSPPVTLAVTPAVPALLSADQSGGGLGAILNQDNTFNSQVPAAPGDIVQLFGVGGGQTTPPAMDGAISSGQAQFNLPVKVFVDGREVPAEFAGPAPGLVEGVFQINVRLPADLRSGRIPVVVFFGDHRTQPGVFILVEQAPPA